MDPTYDLLQAVMAKLRATTAVTALVGSKIFDRVPEKQTVTGPVPDVASPYVSFDYTDAVADDAVCVTGEEIIFQIDAWSWGAGEAYSSVEVRKIAWAIRNALHNVDLTLTANTLITLSHERTRIQRARDGITNHASIRFVGSVEIPS